MNNPTNMNSTKWIELHETLQDLLAGYIDKELKTEDILLVEAHLIGCEACRNDLSRQQVLSKRIELIPSSRMTSSTHIKIDKALEQSSLNSDLEDKKSFYFWLSSPLYFLKKYMSKLNYATMISASGWSVALLLAIIIFSPQISEENTSAIPMIQDALTEYSEMQDKALPVTYTDKNIQRKAPLSWPNTQLLSSWTTDIAGSPAQVFAIRSGHNIIFQYQVDESVFFRNPVVRQAITKEGSYFRHNIKTDVLAIPFSKSGVIVVGTKNSLPKPESIIFQRESRTKAGVTL